MMLPGRLRRTCETSVIAGGFLALLLPIVAGVFYGYAWPLPFPADPWGSITVGTISAAILLASSIPCYLYARLRNSIIWAAPRFMRAVASSVKSGIPLHEAIERVASTGIYGVLGRLLKRAVTRIKAGVDFTEALKRAAREADDPVVYRLTSLLSEAYQAGPKAYEVLDAASEYFTTFEEFLMLRDAATRPYFSIIYLMIGVYLLIVYIIVNVMLTALSASNLPIHITLSPKQLAVLFYWQSFVSSIAAGLFLGKVSYNNVKAGFFHAAILIFIVSAFFALSVLGPVKLPIGAPSNQTQTSPIVAR